MATTGKISPSAQASFPRAKVQGVVMVTLLLLIPLLYPVWLPWIGEFLVVADPMEKAEALVILGGDEDPRVAYAARLFQQGYAGWFVMTDMHLRSVDIEGIYSARVKLKAMELGVPEERILITPGQVSTTYEEVVRLKEFSVSHGLHSLIVVTSPYHTRRARWLLREAFRGSGVTVIVRPVSNHSYQAESWWRNPEDRQQTTLEYFKVLAHLLGCRDYQSCGPFSENWLESLQKTGPGE